jgi:RNA polymerase sigma-70 factor (ECF subfamily)
VTTAPDLADLLRRTAAGDRAAFAALYRATSAKLYGLVSRILPSGEASEALQEAYVKIWQRAADFDSNKGSPLAWMATIARNRALDVARRARPISLEDMGEGFEPVADTEHPLASRDRSEGYAQLMRCLDGLAPERREMILLAYYRGASREAIAKKYVAPVGTVKTWLRRSLADLRDCLSS